jgi:cystathionine beta-synthase
MTQVSNLLDLIGNTPIVQVKNMDTGPCDLFLKMEGMNPGSSIKDRVALQIIETAEQEGLLNKGSTIIEASAGNTALGLALIGKLKGYKSKVVILDKMNQNKIFHLKAVGAEVIITRSDVGPEHPEHYITLAKKIASETPNSFFASQFTNISNPLAHELTTAPEIYRQLKGEVGAIICGVGSGGTISGIGKYFNEHSPNTEIIVADPKGSIIKDSVEGKKINDVGGVGWLVEGIGEDFIPDILKLEYIKKGYEIDDREAFKSIRDLALNEGILAGSSCGTLLASAIRYCKEQTEKKNVVTFVCDNGEKYLNTAYNETWLKEKNLI